MKRFIPISKLGKFKSNKITSWFDRLTFLHIFMIWICAIIIFGFQYYLLHTTKSYLYSTANKLPIQSLFETLYFSFITATTTGFGDIVPYGNFRLIAILEVVAGLLLLAIVTSKLVSIKQNAILSEVYDISFNEKINRLRSSLLVFRQRMSTLISKIEVDTIRKREINDLYLQFGHLEDVLQELIPLMSPRLEGFAKVMDPISTELVFVSVLNSFERVSELLTALNKHRQSWNREITIHTIDRCLQLNELLFSKLKGTHAFESKMVQNLEERKNAITPIIKKLTQQPQSREKNLVTFYDV